MSNSFATLKKTHISFKGALDFKYLQPGPVWNPCALRHRSVADSLSLFLHRHITLFSNNGWHKIWQSKTQDPWSTLYFKTSRCILLVQQREVRGVNLWRMNFADSTGAWFLHQNKITHQNTLLKSHIKMCKSKSVTCSQKSERSP